MSAQERLRNIDVLSYELETDEMITAQLVKTYLSGLPEENALEIMRGVMKGSVIHLAAEEAEDEGQQDTEESRLVEGKQLAALIDTAVASIHRCLEEHSSLQIRKKRRKRGLWPFGRLVVSAGS